MKKMLSILLAVLLIGTLAACGTSSGSSSSASADSQEAAADGQNYYNTLKTIAGLETGTAGSSLKAASAAAHLLGNVFLLGIPEDSYDDCVSILTKDVSNLTADEQKQLAEKYDSTIAPLAEEFLADPDSLEGLFSDAGEEEMAETLKNAPDLEEYWKVFDRAMEEVLGSL